MMMKPVVQKLMRIRIRKKQVVQPLVSSLVLSVLSLPLVEHTTAIELRNAASKVTKEKNRRKVVAPIEKSIRRKLNPTMLTKDTPKKL